MANLLVTGSSGLIGSECVQYFDDRGWNVHGIDSNQRFSFFGSDGDTTWNLERLIKSTRNFHHHDVDIRNREKILRIFKELEIDFIIHCAAQPSHDLAAKRPFEDFDINAVGTLNLLEAFRQECPEAVFAFMSTNKVYGDALNRMPLIEKSTRYDYADPEDYEGVNERCSIDQSMHSIFGVSKVAADLMVQEYGRYFSLKTCCLRGGCFTGARHSAAELHGFLAYMVKCAKERRVYRIFGYKGKQVRDNIHSLDVCRALEEIYKNPRCGEIYNLGGTRENSISVLEAIEAVQDLTGRLIKQDYFDDNRQGDHICYITDMSKFRSHYPDWSITYSLDDIFKDLICN